MLDKIELSSNLLGIEDHAFENHKDLREITIPNNTKRIGKRAFANCKNLRTVIIPEGVEIIDDSAFEGCENISEIVIPDSVCHLGENLFKCCKNLKKIKISKNIHSLPNAMFDRCSSLTDIDCPNQVRVGKMCFRNCKSLANIPDFVASFDDRAFENCTGLKTIDLKKYSHISSGAFLGCSNINNILNFDSVKSLDSFAFSGCQSLTEIDLSNFNKIPAETFSNCSNLKKVKFANSLNLIDSRAFLNCSSLEELNLPDMLQYIKKEAFRGCSKVKTVTIPTELKFIDNGAFSYMDSFEKINVSKDNKEFFTPDHKILIDKFFNLKLYANGLKDKSYSFSDYCVKKNNDGGELISPINQIDENSFAGAKNLEELIMCTCTRSLDINAFNGCPNLKKLILQFIPFGSCHSFSLINNGHYYFNDGKKEKISFPFEKVEYRGENIVLISNDALPNFDNVTEIILPSEDSYAISQNAFSNLTKLKRIFIPNSVTRIDENAIPQKTLVEFENGKKMTGLKKFTCDDRLIGKHKLYSLYDGTYYLEQDNKTITITKDDMRKICSNAQIIEDDPVLYLDYMNDLISHNFIKKYLLNGVIIKQMDKESREKLFRLVDINDEYLEKVLVNSKLLNHAYKEYHSLFNENFESLIDHINVFRKHDINDPFFFAPCLFLLTSCQDLDKLLSCNHDSLKRIFKNSDLFDEEYLLSKDGTNTINNKMIKDIFANNKLLPFIKIIEKYNLKDPLLFNMFMINSIDNPLFKRFLEVYDANMHIALIKSKIIDHSDNASAKVNFNDFLNLLKISGALDEDPIRRQRAITFINEKIFDKELANGQENPHYIVGDNLHRIFNFRIIFDKTNYEFIDFFLENFDKLYEQEKENSGFIERVYLNFKEISKTCTSNKGPQRKLKVTIDKCINYLSNTKFDNISEDNRDFAKLIGAWYDKNDTWLTALKIHKESLNAPRNIFTSRKELENGTFIYDNSPSCDLREKINSNFSYEWLPKQDYNNLILGKYCSCCAHLEGSGQGIMRASIIHHDCQNLVIRDEKGQIISKATVFVNRKEGYAVFNNVETSIERQNPIDLYKVYNAFLRGTKAFLKTYNKNNPNEQIDKITIGSRRNTILQQLNNDNYPNVNIYRSLDFGNYSLNPLYSYNGDWSNSQKLIMKK